jgi:PST family polysaccharide transporter
MTVASADRAETIEKAAGKGLKWSFLSTAGTKLVTFSTGLVLARLLTPADFGTFAIASAATLFVMHINDVGLIAAVVQWRGKLSEIAPTATTMAALFSVAIYATFWFIAPAFARLAGDADAAPVVRLLTVIILIDGVTAVRSAALMRRFQQKRLTVANVAGAVTFAGSAIGMAVTGAGAYSFAGGQVIGSIVTGVLVIVLAKVPFGVRIERQIAAQLFRFGLPLAASLGIEAILTNADYVIVGRFLGVVALGYYLLAFNISGWTQGMIGTAIRYVSIPAFSRLSDRDTDELSRGVQIAVPALVSVLLPIVVLMTTLAPQVVAVLYGDKWAPAVTALRFLMVLAAVRLLTGLALDILTGAGAPRSSLWVNIGWAVVLIPALMIGTHVYGIRGTAMAHALIGVFVALPLAIVALQRTGVRMGPIPRALVRPLAAAAACAVAAIATARVTGPNPVVELIVAGAVGMVWYLAICVRGDQRRALVARVRPPAPGHRGRHRRSYVAQSMRAAERFSTTAPATSPDADRSAPVGPASVGPASVGPAVVGSAVVGSAPQNAAGQSPDPERLAAESPDPERSGVDSPPSERPTLTAVPRWPTYVGSASVPTVYVGYASVRSPHERIP